MRSAASDIRSTTRSRRPRARLLAVAAAVLALGASALTPLAAQAAPTGAETRAAVSAQTVVDRILADTNAIRSRAGKPALKADSRMQTVAMTWSKKQAAAKKMSHNPSYASQIPAGWSGAAENVAMGYGYTSVVDGWEGSPGHLANMTGSYTHIGIGYATDSQGRPYYTQVFGRYATAPAAAHAAVGRLELVRGGRSAIRISGWAFDEDASTSIAVRFTVDGKKGSKSIRADRSRSDVAARYEAAPARTGFTKVIAARKGSHAVCVWAVNAGPKQADKLLGCKRVRVG
ncbi:CAP domain-containing protein [Homoserinibacter sp. YIM 151385]|uniref:CAP domain-containing protein n=1 Tax=Homoserinibacter sp. YIM 151385 TaxID=2985506 RepID=UPI0022F12DD0|nr:CAP domain-containing protein [Homoserinibacter sp. YIM 151385]WBU37175.1 CAP domain-containing protein [Homoserinibacter sp. YIM 151385]